MHAYMCSTMLFKESLRDASCGTSLLCDPYSCDKGLFCTNQHTRFHQKQQGPTARSDLKKDADATAPQGRDHVGGHGGVDVEECRHHMHQHFNLHTASLVLTRPFT